MKPNLDLYTTPISMIMIFHFSLTQQLSWFFWIGLRASSFWKWFDFCYRWIGFSNNGYEGDWRWRLSFQESMNFPFLCCHIVCRTCFFTLMHCCRLIFIYLSTITHMNKNYVESSSTWNWIVDETGNGSAYLD